VHLGGIKAVGSQLDSPAIQLFLLSYPNPPTVYYSMRFSAATVAALVAVFAVSSAALAGDADYKVRGCLEDNATR
jgi:hypothetical protein